MTVTRNLGGAGGPVLVALLQRWPEVVGEQLAAHCWPLSLRAGVLTIGVDDPAWAAQLGWLEADLRRRLDHALGDGVVTRTWCGSVPGPKAVEPVFDAPLWYPWAVAFMAMTSSFVA